MDQRISATALEGPQFIDLEVNGPNGSGTSGQRFSCLGKNKSWECPWVMDLSWRSRLIKNSHSFIVE